MEILDIIERLSRSDKLPEPWSEPGFEIQAFPLSDRTQHYQTLFKSLAGFSLEILDDVDNLRSELEAAEDDLDEIKRLLSALENLISHSQECPGQLSLSISNL